MRHLFTILILLIGIFGIAQDVPGVMQVNGSNFIFPRGAYNLGFRPPQVCGIPAGTPKLLNLSLTGGSMGGLVYDTCFKKLRVWNGTAWDSLAIGTGGSGSGIDSLTYRPGNIIDTLVYWTGGTPTDWYYVVNKDGLISGGQVIYTGSGLDYFVTAATFRKNGNFYSTNDTTLTLPALVSIDSSRTDVFVVNTAGQATTITGVESANPLTPQINPDTEVFLTTITIRPGNAVGEDTLTIYDENIAPPEWVGGSTGTSVDFNNTSVVYRGTKSANVGAIANNNTFGWRGTTLLSQTDYTGSAFFVQLKQNMPANNNLNIAFFNGGTQVTNEIAIPLNKTNASSYQGIAIGFASFTWGNNLFDSIRFRYTGGGGGISGMYMDYVYLQNGLSPVITPSAIILTGDITGTGQTGSPVTTTLSNTGVVAGTYGNADSVGRFTVDAKGRLSFAQNVAIAKTDTSNLSYRIDTVAANIPDTTSLSNRINLKLNISDTANMLGGYIKQAYRTEGIDSIYFIRGDNTVFGVKDSTGAGGSTIAVDTIYRKPGQDSIFFTINGGAERAIKDSVGGGGGGSSQWRDTTNGIYYNGGNVGIETLNPKYRLEVFNEDSIATYPTYANAYSTTLENPYYTGSCMRVRRSSDNTEQDFGFVGGFLDTAALKTFVGANDGRVVIFYDQFGSSNFVQATAAVQPHIIVSGAVQYITNKPALRFLWNSARMTNASITYTAGQKRWIRANIKIDTLYNFATILNAQNVNYGIHSGATAQYIFDGSVRAYTPAFAYLDPTSIRIDSNIATANNTSTTVAFTVPAVNGIVIGANNAGSDKTRGRMSSVFFDSIGVAGAYDTATINGELLTKRLNINDVSATSDTTGYKPVVINTDGSVEKFAYWPVGSGSGGGVPSDSLAFRRVGITQRINTVGWSSVYSGTVGASAAAAAVDSANFIWGVRAGEALTTGYRNILIGRAAGKSLTVHHNFVAIGDSALFSYNNASALTGQIAIGRNALRSFNNNGGGSEQGASIAIGADALQNYTSSFGGSIAIGHRALQAQTTAPPNVAIGTRAGESVTTGQFNTMIGYLSGRTITTGSRNTVINQEGNGITTGNDNTIIGNTARTFAAATSNVTYVGASSESAFVMGTGSTAFGSVSGRNLGTNFVAVGRGALQTTPTNVSPFTENESVAVGFGAGSHNGGSRMQRTSGVYVGYEAGLSGFSAGSSLITGIELIAIGRQAARFQSRGDYNIAIGRIELADSIGSNQLAIGGNAIAWQRSQLDGTLRQHLFNSTAADVTTFTAGAALEVRTTLGVFMPPVMTGVQATALSSTPDGGMIYVTSTDGVFTSVGFWGRIAGTWTALHL